MRALHRKLLRDIFHLRSQVAAIALVIACAVTTMVTSRTIIVSLSATQQSYYATYGFADVFASLKRAPRSLAARIAEIPGVATVMTRIVFDVTLDIPSLGEPATGRIVSLPEYGTPPLNRLHLRRGRLIEPGRRDEVVVSEALADANHLEVGDRIGAILNGRWARLRIVGIALSPEYVYEIRGTDVFPDNKHFGVLWMSEKAVGPAFDLDGAFNDVAIALSPDAVEREVLRQLDRLLEPYGGLGAYGRQEHTSDRFISDEIRQNETFGHIMPTIFLAVASFLLNILLSRLVSLQRDQVGVLKAFGYPPSAIALHYLGFAVAAIVVGSVLGTLGGILLGSWVYQLYIRLYHFPVFVFHTPLEAVFTAIGVSSLAALVGALAAARGAYVLPAAVAMRPEPPPRFQAGILERLGLLRFLSVATRIIVRNITRRPLRAGLTATGVALAVAILMLVGYFREAIQRVADVQYRLVQREDISVLAHEALPKRAHFELANLGGVLRVESFRSVPVRLRAGHHSRRTALLGLEAHSEMRRLVGKDEHEVALPPEGMVLTSKLAELLEVQPGSTVTLEVLDGARPVRQVVVAGLVEELVGLSAYMDRQALSRILNESDPVSGGWLAVDSNVQPALYNELKELPAVGGVSLRAAALESFEKTMGENMTIFTSVLVFFACVTAIAVVYNAARIGLSERGRELASLRVLGYTRHEVAYILLGEQAFLIFAAIPFGYLLGHQLCAVMSSRMQWELMRLPLYLSPRTYVMALLVVVGAAIGSGWIVRRRLDRLDLVEVLKTRE